MISCLVLSAGLSSRFGSPKALVKITEKNVIETIQNILISSPVEEIIIVLGANADQIKPSLLDHRKVKVVYNKDYIFGQTSSFKAGLSEVSSSASGIMLWPVDYAFVNSGTINNLIIAFNKKNPAILIPTFQNKKGHPPIFSTFLKKEFLEMDYRVGLNTIAQKYTKDVMTLEVNDAGVLKTFNTPEELKRLSS